MVIAVSPVSCGQRSFLLLYSDRWLQHVVLLNMPLTHKLRSSWKTSPMYCLFSASQQRWCKRNTKIDGQLSLLGIIWKLTKKPQLVSQVFFPCSLRFHAYWSSSLICLCHLEALLFNHIGVITSRRTFQNFTGATKPLYQCSPVLMPKFLLRKEHFHKMSL